MTSNILLIYTHPNHESLNYSFFQSTLQGLKSNSTKHEIKTIDLYQDGFRPELIFNQETRRRDLHLLEETKAYREMIEWADHLIFIYPIWWGRPPAMLLGFFDRVFTKDFAYSQGSGFMSKGLLGGKEVTCISTMMGPPGYIRLFLGNMHKVMMKKALFSFCGIKKVRFFEFGGMESRGGRQEKALNKVQAHFARI